MDINRKSKEEIKGVHDSASAFLYQDSLKDKSKQLMDKKVNFLNYAELFFRKLHFSASW